MPPRNAPESRYTYIRVPRLHRRPFYPMKAWRAVFGWDRQNNAKVKMEANHASPTVKYLLHALLVPSENRDPFRPCHDGRVSGYKLSYID